MTAEPLSLATHEHQDADTRHWNLGHRPALDGVRGVAFLMVLIGHAGWPVFNRAHEFGVELFFVLSGLLITSVLLSERVRSGRIDLLRFYIRRARRLLPALLVMLAVLSLAGMLGLGRWGPTAAGVVGGLTYTSNLMIINGINIGNLNHLWSLAVEEHFYLVWPLILVVASGRKVVRTSVILVVILVLVAESFIWREVLIIQGRGGDWTRLYSASEIRAASPFLGAALAVLLLRFRPRLTSPVVGVVGVLGVAMLTYLSTGPWVTYAPQYWLMALPLASIASLAVLVAALAPGGLFVRAFSVAWLRWLGRHSYSGYLWHYPIFLGIGGHLTQMNTAQTFGGVALTLLAATLSTRYVEQRWRSSDTAPQLSVTT